MPIYVFFCNKCNEEFENLCSWENKSKVKCPKCNKKVQALLTSPSAIIFKEPKGTSRENNFDYVAKHNFEQAQAQRRAAEAAVKGVQPYKNIDDSAFDGKVV